VDTTLQDPLGGHVLDGRYRIESRIAVGGMATVYRAMDTRLDRVVALKVMHPALATDGEFVERFIREAKAAARLDHTNVVGVYDQGTADSYVYLAMEYVAGCTLRDILRERGALQPRAALDILEPVLAALGAAHRAGLVHRDMKPENVLIGDDGRVKVADFGLVRAVGTDTITSTGSVLGTVSYLAPEQIEHGHTDQRSDVYACGVLLYEMLTGAKPHGGDTPAQILYQHLHDDVAPPSAVVPGLAPQLDSLVTTAAARDPQERPADAVALLGLLRAARGTLTQEQLDSVPPQASGTVLGVDAEDITTVLSRTAYTAPQHPPLARTSRYQLPPDLIKHEEPPAAHHRSGSSRRGLIAVVTVLAVLLGVGAVVWYVGAGQFTSVPAVLAMSSAQAEQKLHAAGLGVSLSQSYSQTVAADHVISTDPAPGTRIRGNGTVHVVLSRGPEQINVPDLGGKPLAQAQQQLAHEGLLAGVVTKAFSDTVPVGMVISTNPPPGTPRQPGDEVTLTVSQGKAVTIPDVTGSTVSDAQQTLEAAGFTVQITGTPVYSDTVPKDSVAQENPAGGGQAAAGETITLSVSKGQQLFKVPDVTGQDVHAASKELQAAGFKVSVIQLFLTGKVFSQTPGANSMQPRNTTITLWAR